MYALCVYQLRDGFRVDIACFARRGSAILIDFIDKRDRNVDTDSFVSAKADCGKMARKLDLDSFASRKSA